MKHQPTDEELMAQAMREVQAQVEAEGQDQLVPQYIEKESQYKFMRDLLKTKDSTKIANLSSEELGKSEHSIRGALKLALLCDTLKMESLGNCYRQEAEILAKTSMARYVKGANFLTLIFTQIRKALSGSTDTQQPKRSWLGYKKGGQYEG